MSISPAGIELIKHFEGRKNIYRDPVNILTGGWGHVIAPWDGPDPAHAERLWQDGDEVSDEQAGAWLAEDIAKAEAIVNKALDRLGRRLEQHEYDALVSACFNLGSAPLRPKTGLYRALFEGRYANVPRELARWNRAGGKVLPGLVRRRAAEARLFRGEDWRSPSPSPSAPRLLRRGMKGNDVADLQLALINLKLMDLPPVASRGAFGAKTEAAVRAFQLARGLTVDGIFGPKSAAALERALGGKGASNG